MPMTFSVTLLESYLIGKGWSPRENSSQKVESCSTQGGRPPDRRRNRVSDRKEPRDRSGADVQRAIRSSRLDVRTIVRYATPDVELSFLLVGTAGLLHAAPRVSIVFIDRKLVGSALQIVGRRARGKTQAQRLHRIDSGSPARANASLLRASAGRSAGTCRLAESDR